MSRVAIPALEDRASLGIAMILVAWLFFSMIDTSVKWLVLAGLPAMQLAFMRYVGHFFISTWLVMRGGLDAERFQTDRLGLVLFRAYLLTSSTALNFLALLYLPLTVTASIMFTSPILVCLLGWPMLGERAGPWRVFGIVLGFVGVLVVMRPFGAEFHWAMLLSLHNALAMALYSILTRKLAGVVSTEIMQFYMGLFGTAVLLPVAVYYWSNPSTALDWVLMILLGVFGWAGHELLTRAHRFATANTLMPYAYFFLLFLSVSGYLIWGHLPDRPTLIGAAIIIGSGLLIWVRTRLHSTSKQAATRSSVSK
ncbi:DMT family transporter [uncultured Litoreibacter sp.]|uniref:DMT family transporter n=1 Tax=uncultured Litoreibacter sp. TaxID=1392394 RepID=UPI00263251E2|nr:DMT family transporter [uncultured Litoreibacter sp.]